MAKCTIDRYRRERDEQYARRVKAEEELARITEARDSLSAKLDSYIIVKGQALACSQDVAEAFKALQKERDAARDESGRKLGKLRKANSDIEKVTKERDEAAEKLAYVHNMGLRFGMMKTSDKPDPYLAHTWEENSDHGRMFREWSASIGWEDKIAALRSEIERKDAALRDAEGGLESAQAEGAEMRALLGEVAALDSGEQPCLATEASRLLGRIALGHGLLEMREAINAEMESYERYGPDCQFEASPMIRAEVLERLALLARAALSPAEEGKEGK